MAEYIERETVLSMREPPKSNRQYQTDNLDDAYGQGWDDTLCCLEHIPFADVVPVVHGRWIEKEAPAVRRYFECSNCGAHENKHTAIKGYYCWRCGAKMDGGDDHG